LGNQTEGSDWKKIRRRPLGSFIPDYAGLYICTDAEAEDGDVESVVSNVSNPSQSIKAREEEGCGNSNEQDAKLRGMEQDKVLDNHAR
jgi:hypothetical protein